MLFSKKVDYALRALLVFSRYDPTHVLSLSAIAEAEAISKPVLSKVLQHLARAGVLRAHPGRQGGYSLWRAPRRITLRQIVEAVEGPILLFAERRPPALTEAPIAAEAEKESSEEAPQARLDYQSLQGSILLLLERCSLADLIR